MRYRKAPFDHPSLCIPNGHEGTAQSVVADPSLSGQAKDAMRCLPAVGAGGSATALPAFLGLSPFRQ